MDDFKIFVDRLKGSEEELLNLSLDPAFMDIKEKELSFKDPIRINGVAYLANEDLVISVAIATECHLPCKLCNQDTEVALKVENLTHLEPTKGIKGHIYDIRPLIREAVLLEVPFIVECMDGHCPERKNIQSFLSKTPKPDQGYRPFKDL